MSSLIIPFGSATVVVPAGEALAVASQGSYQIWQQAVGSPNQPAVLSILNDVQAVAGNASQQTVTSTFTNGATFHTIRHTMASLLARLGVGERLRMESMGHTSVATTQRYTHLVPVDQIEPLRQLSEAVRIDDLLVGPVVRIRRKTTVSKGR